MNKKEAKLYIKEALSLKLSLTGYSKELGEPYSRQEHLTRFPKKLYKYRSFDDFTEDMIVNKYLYLCQAEKLDDQFECSANFSYDSIFKREGIIKRAVIDEIADMVSGFPSSLSKNDFKKLLHKCLDRDNNFDIKRTAAIAAERQDGLTEQECVAALETFGALLSGMWQNEANLKSFEDVVMKALNARKEIGICSLSETNKSQVMWEMYSHNYEGYCIEYESNSSIDFQLNTFPVVYGNKRETNIIKILVGAFLESFVAIISNGEISQIDRCLDYIHLFLTKFSEWSFQKEWRIIGEANLKFPAPKIAAIYVGKKCSDKNIHRILNLSREYGFDIYRQKDNIENLALEFEKFN